MKNFNVYKRCPQTLLRITGALFCALAIITCNITEDTEDTKDVSQPQKENHTTLTLGSPVVEDGGYLPNQYHYTGTSEGAKNTSPPLEWSQVSDNAESLLLFMYDKDDTTQHHWLLYDIPKNTKGITDKIDADGYLNANALVDAKTIMGGDNDRGYYGPAPSKTTHTYGIAILELQEAQVVLSHNDNARRPQSLTQSELGQSILTFLSDESTNHIAYNNSIYHVRAHKTI